MKKRKIAVITGARADYGLLYWLLREIDEDNVLDLQVIATGMHLSPEYGLTYKLIEKDGFNIDAKVDMLLSADSDVGVAKSVGLATIGFADVFNQLSPDIVVVLGDRYEILATVQAALMLKIPVAHIHGGELTEGAIDEMIRHAITKMSHYHFVAAEDYKKRVIQLGEDPWRVFNYGAPGLDYLVRSDLLHRDELTKEIDFQFGELNFLVTYHPVTLEKNNSIETINNIFSAIEYFPNAKIIITKANADSGGSDINKLIDNYCVTHPDSVKVYVAMGIKNYLSAVKAVDVVIGNSSSGIIEVPFMQTPTVNIGNRQRNRLIADSVICCDEKTKDIVSAIEKALSKEFQDKLQHVSSPYGQGDASKKIKEQLKSCSLNVLRKRFYDIRV